MRQEYVNQIKNIEKFYLFYHSSLLTFNPGIDTLLKDIPIKLNNPKFIISHLTDAPDKPHTRIDVEINDLKEYALNDGQDFVFRSCVIYLYFILEDMIIYRKFNQSTDECTYTINRAILNELFEKEESKVFIYKLRELRNAFVHDNSIWSQKRAKRLSKSIYNIEDESFSLKLQNIEIRVNEKIKFLNAKEFKWFIDESINIIKEIL